MLSVVALFLEHRKQRRERFRIRQMGNQRANGHFVFFIDFRNDSVSLQLIQKVQQAALVLRVASGIAGVSQELRKQLVDGDYRGTLPDTRLLLVQHERLPKNCDEQRLFEGKPLPPNQRVRPTVIKARGIRW